MGLPALASPHHWELPAVAHPPVQSRGKPAMLSPPSPHSAVKVAQDQMRGSPPPRHCCPSAPSAACPRSSYSETLDSEADSYRSSRSQSRRSVLGVSHQRYPQWQQQWQLPSQWPFWTPWAYHQSVGQEFGPRSRSASVSLTSVSPTQLPPPPAPSPGRGVPSSSSAPPNRAAATAFIRAPPAPHDTPSRSLATLVPAAVPHLDSEPAPQPQYHVPQDPKGPHAPEVGPLHVISSSSSADEAVSGMAAALALEDTRIVQQLLRRAAQSLAIQVEEIEVDADPVMDILAPSGPSRVALPLIKTIADTSHTL
ncbi:wiskott-Aldrich syndrome protein homolog 1-like [Gopherus evgoodei]|uniref:wiskott-Aldrich syndrome protein homolog 1-like n=1 Tax=Gopherus evgoodei TaxID=1825980 RepID=UPI0011CEEBFD|nr:wiskott-Aldrich syndrome protein homolog 1-like [Gopherus evgoodei]